VTVLHFEQPKNWSMVPDDNRQLIKFPGGEWHVKGAPFKRGRPYCAVIQGSSADDIIALAIWADAVHRDGGIPHAVIPYFPGARQDRRQPGEALSVKVYADIVNAMNLASVSILDPHSAVIVALLDRVNVLPDKGAYRAMTWGTTVDALIAPDAGALKRTEAVAQMFNVPVVQATKKRDMSTGRLTGFSVPDIDNTKVYGIVDDICDGGGTFIGLAQATGLDRGHLRLYVTHGIFSGVARDTLPVFYGSIHTTNSFEQNQQTGFIVHTMDWENEVPL
jgi:ribose-phosphate pyrophosphokinase